MNTERLRSKAIVSQSIEGSVLRDYISITGPGITLLMLITALSSIWIASKGAINTSLLFWTLIGLALCCSGSSILNNCYDADIDAVMGRTKNRAIPLGRIDIRSATKLAIILIFLSFLVLSIFVNLLSAFLSMIGVFIYYFLYTRFLKRKTPHATEIGGIAGALPPLIGWAAVKNGIDAEAFVLFLIILIWQPIHFWSLASLYRDDYIRAKIPVMPVISERKTLELMLIYLVLLSVASILPFVFEFCGSFYLRASIFLNVIYFVIFFMKLSGKKIDRTLFRYSIVYLSLIFLSMLIDL